MIKAPLDETNISPTTIIDELTECNVEPQGDGEKGYINGVECLFDYWSNVMHITFATAEELEQKIFQGKVKADERLVFSPFVP